MREDITDIYEDAESLISADELDLDFIVESIEDQVSNLLESDSKKNYLKTFEYNIDHSDLSEEDREVTRDNMYNRIIDIISEKFDMKIDKANIALKQVAKNLYKFFVINYTENVEQFLEIYIIEHLKDIVAELERKNINSRRIEGISSKKIAMVLNNISFVIEIINASNVSFKDFLSYIIRHPDSKSCASELLDYLDDIIEYDDDIMEYVMSQLVNEEEGFGNIYTELQRRLYERFNDMM